MKQNWHRAFLLSFFCWMGMLCARAENAPEIFSLPPGTLARLKAKIAAKDKSIQPAWDALIKDADKALNTKPASVMDKPRAGASGDKHDYLSTAPYFWPDTNKPNGLPYIRRDGYRNPESGNEYSDSPRLGRTCGTAKTLALVYCLTGEEKYAEHAAKLLRVFFLDAATRMNPNFNQAQAIPGINTGRGTGMIESRGLTFAADAIMLLRGSKHWTKADDEGMTKWFTAFLDWSLTSKNGKDERDATNNHGSFYDAQVAHFALFTGQTNAAREIITAAKEKRIAAQVRADGSMPRELEREDSFAYSRFNLLAFFDLATLAEHAGVDLWKYESKEGGGIRKALDFLMPYVEDGDKAWPYEKSKKPSRMLDLRILRQAWLVYRDERYLKAAEKVANAETQRDGLFYPVK